MFITLAPALKARNLKWFSSITPSSFASSVVVAAHAVAAGTCDCVLVVRGMSNPKGRFGRFEHRQASAPWGVYGSHTALGIFYSAWALPYSRYLSLYGATRESTWLRSWLRTEATRRRILTLSSMKSRSQRTSTCRRGSCLSLSAFSIATCRSTVARRSCRYDAGEGEEITFSTGIHFWPCVAPGINHNWTPVITLDAFERSADDFARSLWK